MLSNHNELTAQNNRVLTFMSHLLLVVEKFQTHKNVIIHCADLLQLSQCNIITYLSCLIIYYLLTMFHSK